jgi:hypothetical protein
VVEQRLPRSELLGQLSLREEIVDSGMAEPANVDAARAELLLCVPLLKSPSAVNGLGNQMVKRERLVSSAKLAKLHNRGEV